VARPRHSGKGCLLLPLLLVAGCATAPTDPAGRAAFEEANDPLEPMNRSVFEFNRVLDGLVLKNVALFYRTVVPDPVRNSLRHLLDNLKEPVVFANDVFQGEMTRAGTTLARFGVNTTLGIGGLLDVATDMKLKQQTGDFGQTLYRWGVPDGPYLVLPLFGPSNPRDAAGMGVDSYIDPVRYLARSNGASKASLAAFILDGVDQRSRHIEDLDAIERSSLDFYSELRSLWRQQRAQELAGDAEATPPTGPGSIYEDPAAKPGAPHP
jgi:phospholipid-binding lipoprotein MlaA